MPKIRFEQEKEVLQALEFMNRRFGISVILSMCLTCRECYGVKNGLGNHGISHGYCPECGEIVIKKAKEGKNVDGNI
jgi:predicted RNA-binding Zn-ribbon protein involved in translation (DUF1610 family)